MTSLEVRHIRVALMRLILRRQRFREQMKGPTAS